MNEQTPSTDLAHPALPCEVCGRPTESRLYDYVLERDVALCPGAALPCRSYWRTAGEVLAAVIGETAP